MKKFIFIFLILLLTGCGGRASSGDETAYVIALPVVPGAGTGPGDPYPAPLPDLTQYYGAPLPAVLQTTQGEQMAALGSSCWTQELVDGAPVENCLENPGIPTPQTFLPVDTQFSGRLRLPLPIPPAGISIFVMPVTSADVLEPPADGVILWPYREGDAILLSTEIEQDLQLELNPGLNVLYVNARWDGLGAAGFGFLLEARTP
ncbi:MAG: hypothetical protein R6V73_00295 [Anaerolineales bacterium]